MNRKSLNNMKSPDENFESCMGKCSRVASWVVYEVKATLIHRDISR